MDQQPPNPKQDPTQSRVSSPPLPPPPLHQTDADDDDENVKQLQECSSLYLSLQDCLVNTNRNWKSCQKGMLQQDLFRFQNFIFFFILGF
ncbi:hypothetical protein Dsin_029418 [Dipteronia sinensis]|uniref:Uncharacterized protein n=1 Tax=Dipteronia sinensis TaxID=43782 RepID=A0AAD9ZSN2_9ROSI|nr:hypothetical protein Dsin_029418 [Dipteronia sinensis]